MTTIVFMILCHPAQRAWPGAPDDSNLANSYDIVIYGGTSAGAVAAVQATRMGKTAIIVHSGKHLGGLTSSGLGATDIGNKQAIGGIAREFYQRLGKHYGRSEAWTFEPHVAEATYKTMLAAAAIPVVFAERLDLRNGVEKQDDRIVAITTENGLRFAGKVFIDATYEGDLMAKAGVSYHVGREANVVYGETLNGVQTKHAKYHQFESAIDPYVVAGDPRSGLLPGIHAGGPGAEGSGDRRIQAYCFRMCLTNNADNRLPFPKPSSYTPLRYELLLRYMNAGHWTVLNLSKAMPNNKTDTNNKGAFATDNIGMNYEYPDGDYETRERIVEEHKNYQQGLMWFLANDPRVPPAIQDEVNEWGLPRDEFSDNGGWPHEIYVREARRMISAYVMTQHDCEGSVEIDDAVGLAAYTMDSHHVQRYVADGRVRNEGDVEVGGFPPYPIAYRSIHPKRQECENLLVPVCLSASHIAFGSIRMEPVFMVLGQSAATAACMAINNESAVQDVDVGKLQSRLKKDGQVMAWTH
jgi:ribulose 1,5-bisphosphate synthetase/thiazole synthase